METNVIMNSSDRELFGHIIRQETKTGFLSLTDLQTVFDSIKTKKGWINKQINELISRKENVERIYYILEKQNIINLDLSKFIEMVDNNGIATTLKAFGAYRTTGARVKRNVWCNPYIWILIALELSPEMYANAVIWLTDSLILDRIEAGNMYKGLTSAMKRFNNVNYAKLGAALNYVVFGKHEMALRNKGTESQLKELHNLERSLAFSIESGYITSFDQLLNDLRKIYQNKYYLSK